MATRNTDAQSEPKIDVTNPYTPRRPSPIISISVNHPIGAALRKIKNFLTHKQTLFSTTFNIKVTPIVALVSFFGVAALFGGGITTAFNFGKTVEQRFLAALPSPTPMVVTPTPKITPSQAPIIILISRSGTIKATYQLPPTTSNISSLVLTITPTNIPYAGPSNMPTNATTASETTIEKTSPTPTLIPKPTPAVLHYILVARNGGITFLKNSPAIHIQNYLNLHVLITGSFESSKNTLNIAQPEDIEVLQ